MLHNEGCQGLTKFLEHFDVAWILPGPCPHKRLATHSVPKHAEELEDVKAEWVSSHMLRNCSFWISKSSIRPVVL